MSPTAAPVAGSGVLVPELDAAAVDLLDVSIGSDAVDDGAWLDDRLDDDCARAAIDGWAEAAVLPWVTPRLTASRIHSSTSSATVPTGIDVWFAEPQRLASPGAGAVLASYPGRLVVALDGGLRLELDGEVDRAPAHGTQLAAADALGVAAAGSRVRIRLVRADAPPVPHLVRPEYAAGWLALTADPAPLLGLEPLAAERHPASTRSPRHPAPTRPDRAPRPPTPPPWSPGATAASPRCRSTTTTPRRASSAAGAST